ncbi:MAG: hypothetical protein KJP06_07085 [Deltaproteobacteria bacterium]|nr:hypothetical protein [Deltaproteobacteria bacterium]
MMFGFYPNSNFQSEMDIFPMSCVLRNFLPATYVKYAAGRKSCAAELIKKISHFWIENSNKFNNGNYKATTKVMFFSGRRYADQSLIVRRGLIFGMSGNHAFGLETESFSCQRSGHRQLANHSAFQKMT